MPMVASPFAEFDLAMMERCLQLARQGEGKTAPNPLVGSVIVQAGEIISQGFHPQAGQPHAEIFALRSAGEQAKNATLYVNLEPCNHYGRTPPCTEAIIQAGIQRVVVGMIDPNPLVAGQGIERLRQAGISVTVGVQEAACQRLNEAFVHRIRYQRPWGILKYAMTLDGQIAASTGHSAWVTGTAARQRVHHLRSVCEAVIVGGNTVRKDNPQLTSHGRGVKNPLRVVMSRSLDLPIQAQLWEQSLASTLIFTGPQADEQKYRQLEDLGLEIISLPQLTPLAVLAQLQQRDCLQVLWECGGTLAATAIAAQCVQKVIAVIAPKLIGGEGAPTPLGDLGFSQMTQALPLHHWQWEALGADCWVSGYLSAPGETATATPMVEC